MTEICDKTGLSRCASQNVLKKDLSKKSVRAVKSANLTPKDKAGRVLVCKEISKQIKSKKINLEKVAFSDEKLFTCGQLISGPTRNSRLWFDKAIPKKNLPAKDLAVVEKRWAAGVAISHEGCLAPHFVERGVKINGAACLYLAQNVYVSSLSAMFGGQEASAFQQDYAPARNEKGAKEWKRI